MAVLTYYLLVADAPRFIYRGRCKLRRINMQGGAGGASEVQLYDGVNTNAPHRAGMSVAASQSNGQDYDGPEFQTGVYVTISAFNYSTSITIETLD